MYLQYIIIIYICHIITEEKRIVIIICNRTEEGVHIILKKQIYEENYIYITNYIYIYLYKKIIFDNFVD